MKRKVDHHIFEKIIQTVIAVEREFGPPRYTGTGRLKREIALDFLCEVVRIPYLPRPIKRFLLGILIDFTIHLFNKLFGHQWLVKLSPSKDPPEITKPIL